MLALSKDVWLNETTLFQSGKILIKGRLLSIWDDVKASHVLSRDLMTNLEIVYAFGLQFVIMYSF